MPYAIKWSALNDYTEPHTSIGFIPIYVNT